MKILIIGPEKPYTGAESLVTGKLVRAFLNVGWEVDLIYHDSDLIYDSKIDTLKIIPCITGIKNQILSFLARKWKKIPILKKIHLLDSGLWIVKATLLSKKLHKQKKYDLLISRIMPKYGHIPAYFLKISYPDLTWVANWSDPLPQSKSPVPYGKGIEAKVNILEMMYVKKVISLATYNTFPSNRLKDYYLNYLSNLEHKAFVLPHVILSEEEKSIGINQVNDHSNNSFTITHLGGLGLRSPANLLKAFAIFIENSNNLNHFKLRFVGTLESEYKNLIKELNIQQYVILDGIKTYEETLNIIQDSDLMMVIEAPSKVGIFLPSKLMDYLHYSKPVLSISPLTGVMNDLIGKHGGGLVADCTSIDSILKTLKKVVEDENLILDGKGIYNTIALKENFKEEIIINFFLEKLNIL